MCVSLVVVVEEAGGVSYIAATMIYIKFGSLSHIATEK